MLPILAKLIKTVSIFFFLLNGTAVKNSAAFSLIVYKKHRVEIPEGYKKYIDLPSDLQVHGYYAESYLNESSTLMCHLIIANRGTYNIWNTYEDFLIFLEIIPEIFIHAKIYSDYVTKQAVEKCGKKNRRVWVTYTGHSLGAALAELQQFSSPQDVFTFSSLIMFDNPGTLNMMKKIKEKYKMSDEEFHRRSSYNKYYIFSLPNAINTANQQAFFYYPFYYININRWYFSNSPSNPFDISLTYYLKHYTFQAHKMINFYNYFNHLSNYININSVAPLIDIEKHDSWPIGIKQAYEYYRLSTNMNSYWISYINYQWKNNNELKRKYNNNYFVFYKDFMKNLRENSQENEVFNKDILIMTELDNQIVHYNAITNRSSNLARVINSKLNDRETLLRKIYLKSNLDKKLYYAVIANDIRFAQKLILKFNADVNSVYGPSKYSLLQISIILGYYDMMKLLLKHKADVSYKNNDGDTAFDLSIKERNVAANKFMIAISVATNKIAFFQKQK